LSENPSAMHLLENNPDKIHWSQLSKNRSAMRLTRKNPDKIDWESCLKIRQKALFNCLKRIKIN